MANREPQRLEKPRYRAKYVSVDLAWSKPFKIAYPHDQEESLRISLLEFSSFPCYLMLYRPFSLAKVTCLYAKARLF